jgi:hypothetical protein
VSSRVDKITVITLAKLRGIELLLRLRRCDE